MLFITVNNWRWSPCCGWWLFTIQYLRWYHFLLVHIKWSQILIIWYGFHTYWLFIYEDIYWVFCFHLSQIQCLWLPIIITSISTCFSYEAYVFTKYVICSSYLLPFIFFFIDQNSKLDRFLTWYIFNVPNCLK